MKKQNKKGFTLVELLVVIAILAILATVSVVGYSSFTKQAKKSNAEQELSQIKTMLLADWLDGYVGEAKDERAIVKSTVSGEEGYKVDVQWVKAAAYTEDSVKFDTESAYVGDLAVKITESSVDKYYVKSSLKNGATKWTKDDVVSTNPDVKVTDADLSGSTQKYNFEVSTSANRDAHSEYRYEIVADLISALDATDVGNLKKNVYFVFKADPSAATSAKEGSVVLTAVKYVQGNGFTATWDLVKDTITSVESVDADKIDYTKKIKQA